MKQQKTFGSIFRYVICMHIRVYILCRISSFRTICVQTKTAGLKSPDNKLFILFLFHVERERKKEREREKEGGNKNNKKIPSDARAKLERVSLCIFSLCSHLFHATPNAVMFYYKMKKKLIVVNHNK